MCLFTRRGTVSALRVARERSYGPHGNNLLANALLDAGKRQLEDTVVQKNESGAGAVKRARTVEQQPAHPPPSQPQAAAAETEDADMADAASPPKAGAGDGGGGGAAAAATAGSKVSGARVWHDDTNTAFVKGLPHGTKEADLQALFAECGPITSVRIPTFPNGDRRVRVM
jgi:hypothetical protein